MGASRKNNPNYHRGVDSLGRNAWLRNTGDVKGLRPASVENLLAVEDDGADGVLPRPPEELLKFLHSQSDWSNMDLSGYDLRGIDNPGGAMEGACFAGSDLRGVCFDDAWLRNADFSGALTEGMSVSYGANLDNIKTDGTFDLAGVSVGDTLLTFENPTRLVGLDKIDTGNGGSLTLGGVLFEGEEIDPSVFEEVNRVERSVFRNCRFAQTGSRGNRFAIEYVQFRNCEFDNVDAGGLTIDGALYSECTFVDSCLDGWKFGRYTEFARCEMRNVSMRGWGLAGEDSFGHREVKFARMSTNNVNLSDADAYIVRELVAAGVRYPLVGVEDAAKREGLTPEEFAALVWLGDREVRANQTFKKVTEGDISDCHVPYWSQQ